MLKAVILDLDDTIVNSTDSHNIALKHVLNYYFNNNNALYNEARSMVHNRLNGTAASHSRLIYFKEMLELVNSHDYEKLLEIENSYWNFFYANLKVEKGIIKLLEFFKRKEIRICVLTNFQLKNQILKLDNLNLLKYIDILITSEEIGI